MNDKYPKRKRRCFARCEGFDRDSEFQFTLTHRTVVADTDALQQTLSVEQVSAGSDPTVGGHHRRPADRTDVVQSRVGVGRWPHRVDESPGVAATTPEVAETFDASAQERERHKRPGGQKEKHETCTLLLLACWTFGRRDRLDIQITDCHCPYKTSNHEVDDVQ